MKVWTTALLAAVLLMSASPSVAADGKSVALGGKVPNSNSLRDVHGGKRPLHGFSKSKAVVLVFLGVECPVSNLYLKTLSELESQFRDKQVQFLAVYPNEAEDLDHIAMHASDHDLPLLLVKDFSARLADSVGVTRVPSVAVLDADFTLRYRGRIDDRYGAAIRRSKASRDDLKIAVAEVLEGKKVSVPETEADGCLINREAKPLLKEQITFAKHVAPILQRRCQSCHRPDQNAPFSLLSYDDAVRHAPMIREVTTQRRMPPWHADPRHGKFVNDRRLSTAELDILTTWIESGKSRGDDRDLPKPIDFPKGWVHGEPDLILTMPEEFEVPADGVLPYKNWIIDTGFTEDKWVTISEARPGNPAVVHHIVEYIMKEGQRSPIAPDGSLSILVGWAPGDLGLVCPPDTALRVPKGSKLRLEMHYTPNGKAVKDRSSIGLTFAKKPPKYEMFINEFANMSFVVPPHHPHYRSEATFRLRADARILSFAPHMHWRGKDYMYEVIYPDGKRQTLLSVPRWDFNWQNVYRFQEPIKLPKGAKLHAVAHWDNSVSNPYNPDPTKPVRFGLQTWEEMMVGFVAYVWERPETAEELAKNPPSLAELTFDRMDLNGDDFITPEEIPDRLKPFLGLGGLPMPDKISREEFTKLFEAMRKLFPKKN